MQVTDILGQYKKTLTAFISSLIIVSGLALSSCGELSESQTQRMKEALNDTLLSSTESWGVDMKLFEKGEKKVRIQGSYAATYNSDNMNETRIRGPVYVQVFDSTGAIKIHVTSNRAVYHPQESVFELYGNVKVRTNTQRRLQSEFLKWDEGTDKVSTPQFVIITTPSDSISGSGFEGTTDLSEYNIQKVTGQFTIN